MAQQIRHSPCPTAAGTQAQMWTLDQQARLQQLAQSLNRHSNAKVRDRWPKSVRVVASSPSGRVEAYPWACLLEDGSPEPECFAPSGFRRGLRLGGLRKENCSTHRQSENTCWAERGRRVAARIAGRCIYCCCLLPVVPAGGKLIEYYAVAPEIHRLVVACLAYHLWRHVV
eukprot:scaffold2984_cov452-Prasinococcus_capsulatus_cf.AAC.15